MSDKSRCYRKDGERIVRYRIYQEEEFESEMPFNKNVWQEIGINRRITRWAKEASCDRLHFPSESKLIHSTHKPISRNRKGSSASSERTHRSAASITHSIPPSTSYHSDCVPRLTNGPNEHYSSGSGRNPKITSPSSEARSHSRALSSRTQSSHVTSSTRKPKDSIRSSFCRKK